VESLNDLRQMLQDPVAVQAARYGIALLFAVAAVSKAKHFSIFRATILDYQLVPKQLLGLAALAVLGLEFFIALSALHDSFAAIGMQLAAALLCLYGLAIATNLLRGRRDIDCGCTGPAVRQSLSGWLVLRNVVLATIAIIGAGVPIERALNFSDYALIGLALGAAIAIYAAANQLMANAPRLDSLDALMEAN